MKRNQVVILAASKDHAATSSKQTVLCSVFNKPSILHVVDAVKKIDKKPMVIVNQGDVETIEMTQARYIYAEQSDYNGTGGAILSAQSFLANSSSKNIVVVSGDNPLISNVTLKKLLRKNFWSESPVGMVVADVSSFTGDNKAFRHHGRVVRDKNGVISGVVEYLDATSVEKRITEVNVGCYVFDRLWLLAAIKKLTAVSSNIYNITDLISIAYSEGVSVDSVAVVSELEGVDISQNKNIALIEKHLYGDIGIPQVEVTVERVK